MEKWKRHCPIQGFIGKLEQAGYLSSGLVDGLEADVQQEVARAVAFAEAGTLEPVEDLEKDVYTPPEQAAAAKPATQEGPRW